MTREEMLYRAFLPAVSLSHQCLPVSLQTEKLWGPINAKKMAANGQGNRQPPLVNVCSGCGISDNIASASLAI